MKVTKYCGNCRYSKYIEGDEFYCHKIRNIKTDKQGREYLVDSVCPADFGKTCKKWKHVD